jgi:D-3-phosphoglycerate dehydrogenase
MIFYPKMKEKVRIRIAESDDFSHEVIDYLKEFAEVVIAPCGQEELAEIFEEYDVFWFRLAYTINRTHFSFKSRIKVLATPVTGIDHIDEIACTQNQVEIVCLKGEKEFLQEIRATAEHTIGLTLALKRHLHNAISHTQKGLWDRDLYRGTEIYKKQVGIIGLGRLGKITAGYFMAFGAIVKAFDIVHDQNEIEYVNSLEYLAENSDIISIHVDLNSSTRNFINKDFFDKIKPNAIIINTSRGGVINETDLLDALKSRKIAGAALDVIAAEYDDKNENPLLIYSAQNRNLIVTPHIGGNTFESFYKTEFFIARKIRKIFF